MKGDEPGTKPSFYEFSMLNLFADTWRGIRGQVAPNSRQPSVPLNTLVARREFTRNR